MHLRTNTKWPLGLGLSILAVYLFLVPVNSALYDVLMFPAPDSRIPNVDAEFARLEKNGVTKKEVILKSANGKRLEGWFLEVPGTRRVFLYSHSKGNNIYAKIHVAESLLTCGGSVFMYDYQGFGKSEGRASLQNACDDGVAAYDYLIDNEHRSDKDIIGFGESIGSGVTGQLLKKRRLAGVIFQSGFASMKSAAMDKAFWLRFYPDWCFPRQIMDNMEVFSKPHPPLLISHGTNDHVVSYENAMMLYNTAIPIKMFLTMPGGGHGSVGAKGEFYIAVRKFLNQNKL
jgi:fermentation-respiration switch protein FrsA (DUF1100 family)